MKPVASLALAMTLTACAAPGAVAAWEAPSPTRRLETAEGRLAYDLTGESGPLVVCVPGMGDLRGEYRYLAPRLAEAGYRVASLDLRGHGESDVGFADLSARAVGRDVLALIAHLGADSAVVMGNSFAAGAAAWAAHEAPDRVSGMVFFGPIVRDLPQPFYMGPLTALAFGGPWRVGFWTGFWDHLFPTRKPADHQQYKAALAANMREPGRMDALKTMVSLSKAENEAVLGQTPKPTLIVMGTKDPDFADPAAEAAWVAGRTGGEVQLVEGAGHYPHAEMPEVVAPRVLAFLEGLK